jgi:hypothetical protein
LGNLHVDRAACALVTIVVAHGLEICGLPAVTIKLRLKKVNTPPPKGGGFELRLKAGFGPPSAD